MHYLFSAVPTALLRSYYAAKEKEMSKITYVEILDIAFYLFILTRN